MNEAVHRFKRTKVLATSAEASRPYPYVCPECGVTVHYVSEFTRYNGIFVSARFDHEANSVRAHSCRWFRQGSEGIGSNSSRSTRTVFSRSAPRLMIRVAKEKWTLGIFIPHFENTRGTFDLGEASPALTAFDLSSVPAVGDVFEVYPQMEPYSVEIRAVGSPNTRIPVGAIGEFSIFAASTGWGQHLGEDEILAWNKGYVAVGPKLPTSFLKLVLSRPLPRTKSALFDAVLFKLPPVPNSAIVRAAKSALGREILYEALVATVVAPVTAHCGPDRTWILPRQGGGLVVAYSFGNPTERTSCVRLLPRDANTPQQSHVLPVGTTQGCVQFPSIPMEYFEIRFDAAPDSPVCVEPVSTSGMDHRTPWPTFGLGIEVEGAILSCPLWHGDLPNLLSRIRRGEVKLIDVRAPISATVLVQLSSTGQVDRKQISFSDSLNEHDFGEQERAVADLLRVGITGANGLLIDAGGFGRIQFPLDEPPKIQPLRPHSSLRSRWLDLIRRVHGSPPSAWGYPSPRMRRFQAHLRVEQQMP